MKQGNMWDTQGRGRKQRGSAAADKGPPRHTTRKSLPGHKKGAG